MLLNSFLIQIFVVIFGMVAGILLKWLASEELSLYSSKILFIQKTLFILTFISALFFSSYLFLISFLALSYGIIAFPQRNEFQIFYYIAPLVLFLSTETQEGFFLTSALLFLATVVSVPKAWNSFLLISVLLYGIVYIVGLF